MASQRVEELRQALRSGSSLTREQAEFNLEMIDAFERLLREQAAHTMDDIERYGEMIRAQGGARGAGTT